MRDSLQRGEGRHRMKRMKGFEHHVDRSSRKSYLPNCTWTSMHTTTNLNVMSLKSGFPGFPKSVLDFPPNAFINYKVIAVCWANTANLPQLCPVIAQIIEKSTYQLCFFFNKNSILSHKSLNFHYFCTFVANFVCPKLCPPTNRVSDRVSQKYMIMDGQTSRRNREF